jgi:hypothetical protein
MVLPIERAVSGDAVQGIALPGGEALPDGAAGPGAQREGALPEPLHGTTGERFVRLVLMPPRCCGLRPPARQARGYYYIIVIYEPAVLRCAPAEALREHYRRSAPPSGPKAWLMTEATGHTLEFTDAQGAKRKMVALGTSARPDRFLLYPPAGEAGGEAHVIDYCGISAVIRPYAQEYHPARLKVSSLGGATVRTIFNDHVDPDGHKRRKRESGP